MHKVAVFGRGYLHETSFLKDSEGNLYDSSQCMRQGGSWLQMLGLGELGIVAHQNIYHGKCVRVASMLLDFFETVRTEQLQLRYGSNIPFVA